MTSQAERKRAKKAKTVSKTREVKPTPDTTVHQGGPAETLIRDGLLWLIKKNRLNISQRKAAVSYRDAYREPRPGAMRSHLDDSRGSGGGGAGFPPDYNLAFHDAQDRLNGYRTVALANHGDMIRLMDCVVGNGLTLAEAEGGDYRKAEKSEPVLKIALDLIAQHLDPKETLTTPHCVLRKSA